jgi:aminoglycoside phosphotransferase (APT) family kinase protein
VHIVPTARYLALIDHVLAQVIAPNLDEQHRAVLAMVQGGLRELAKREERTPAFLLPLNLQGEEFLQAMHMFAEKHGVSLTEVPSPPPADPIERHSALSDSITRIGKEIASFSNRKESAKISAEALKLLRDGADWDIAYSRLQRETIELPGIQPTQLQASGPFNAEKILRAFQMAFPGAPIRFVEFNEIPGGMGKRTYRCRVQDTGMDTDDFIVRKDDGNPVFSFSTHKIANELHLLKGLAATGYPAPQPMWLSQNDKQFDSDFYITRRLPGAPLGTFFGPTRSIPDKVLLDLATQIAHLHRIDLTHFSHYMERLGIHPSATESIQSAYRHELDSWDAFLNCEGVSPSPFAIYALEWLRANRPKNTQRPSLIHGDFNLHNVLCANDQITAILDWELALFGDPAQDLAYVKPNIERLIEWPRFMERYYASGGRPVDESTLGYYVAFANFRPFVGALVYMHRFLVGSSGDARAMYIDNEFLPQFMENFHEGVSGMNL